MNSIELITDQAICENDCKRVDGLGFNTYSKILTNAAIGTKGPFTIGIFGEWGSGKTSLLKMIESELKNSEVITVWFNAWQYESDEHPIIALIATIISSIKKHDKLRNLNSMVFEGLIKALRGIAYGFSSKAKIKIPGFSEIEASFVAKDMIDRTDQITNDPLLDKSIYYESYDKLSKVANSTSKKIVILIDDLDRCFPDRAIKLLESIKLILSQPGFIFFIGVARSVIEGYLQHRYKEEYGIKDFQGEQYLDKIIQLPFYLPSIQEKMSDFVQTLITTENKEQESVVQQVIEIVSVGCNGNQRTAIRLINNLLIDSAILSELKNKIEIPLSYFAVTRLLQQKWHWYLKPSKIMTNFVLN